MGWHGSCWEWEGCGWREWCCGGGYAGRALLQWLLSSKGLSLALPLVLGLGLGQGLGLGLRLSLALPLTLALALGWASPPHAAITPSPVQTQERTVSGEWESQ